MGRDWIWCVVREESEDEAHLRVINPRWVSQAVFQAGRPPSQDQLVIEIGGGQPPARLLFRGAEARRVWKIVSEYAPRPPAGFGRMDAAKAA